MLRSVLATILALALLGGCNGNAGTQAARTVNVVFPGAQESFLVSVTNNTQFPVFVFITANGGGQTFGIPAQGTGILCYPGTSVQTDVGFLPSDVEVAVVMQTNPLYAFPQKTLLIGTDFEFWQSSVSVSFP